ncbi:MAG: HPr(Ser) kinase/phosphatase [Deltaproteobacteria bacterium]|nr:HPr(Ser) kinase/phosphatase [Deltaproteobacteria bacterium]
MHDGSRTSITVGRLLEPDAAALSLSLVAGQAGLAGRLTVPRIQKTGLAFTGHTSFLHSDRLQVFGASEINYLGTLDKKLQRSALEKICTHPVAAIAVTKGLAIPGSLSEVCEKTSVPLLATPLPSSRFFRLVTEFLERHLAPRTSIHGVFVDVMGVGILLLGKSGIGKSECALDLVRRGHRLVADDIVEVRKRIPDTVIGESSEMIQHHMEIRGLGIINIKDIFGISSVRERKRIELVANLVEWNERDEYDRLGLEERFYSLLDVEIPMVIIPVRHGRDMATLIEVMARDHLLRVQGHHSARVFQEKLARAIAAGETRADEAGEVE